MEKNDSIEKAAVAAVGKGALSAVAATLAAYCTTNSPIAAGVSGGVAALGEALSSRYFAQRQGRMQKLWEEMLSDDTRTPEGVADWIRAQIENPETADVVMRSIRSATDVPCELALPALAMLAKEYLGSGRATDRYFRGVTRMLMDCDIDDIAPLQTALRMADEAAENKYDVAVCAVEKEPQHKVTMIAVRRDPPRPGDSSKRRVECPSASRVVNLIAMVGSYESVWGGGAAILSAEEARRLHALACSMTPPGPPP